MRQILKRGWKTAFRHPLLIFLFYIYHFAWGFFLYKLVFAVVRPVLLRYPETGTREIDVNLYWLEFHFRMVKTDLIAPYLWTLAGLLLARMILTPVLQAGLFYCIHQDHNPSREERAFIRGIKIFSRSFFGYYVLRSILGVIPLFWLVPFWMKQLHSNYDWTSFFGAIFISVTCYIGYLLLLQFLFMYNLFRLLTETSLLEASRIILRLLPQALVISIVLCAVSLLAATMYSLVSWLQAGFFTLILYHLYPLMRLIIRFWNIGSHYQLWREKEL